VQSSVRVVQVTDLAISAKLSRHGSLVWVSRLSNGQPAASVEVELRRPNAAPKRIAAPRRPIRPRQVALRVAARGNSSNTIVQ